MSSKRGLALLAVYIGLIVGGSAFAPRAALAPGQGETRSVAMQSTPGGYFAAEVLPDNRPHAKYAD